MKKFGWVLIGLASFACNAQDTVDLFDEIAMADADFFTAFNACDIATMGKTFSPDLEFYHDISGVNGYEKTMAVTRANCDRKLGLKRTLVDGSMRVFPVPGFGAIQEGVHTFCHLENGKNDCGTFEFVHVWRKTDDGWQLCRVVSYGH